MENILKSLRELYDLGVLMSGGDSEINKMLENMYLLKRGEKEFLKNNDVLLELIYNYDMSQFDIGGVSFFNPEDFFRDDNYFYIGTDGAGDYIAIDKENNSIYNIVDDNALEINIAKSGVDFLNNLIEVGKYNFSNNYSENSLNEILNKIFFDNESRKFYFSLLRSS